MFSPTPEPEAAREFTLAMAAASACRTISGTDVISQSVPWHNGPSANSPVVATPSLAMTCPSGRTEKAKPMFVGSRETLEQQALDERLIEVRPITRAIDRKIRMQGFDNRGAAASQAQCKAIVLANDAGHGAAHENGAASFELGQDALMHLAWQAMAMRVPERTHMTQEAALFLR